jgi:peptidoglycan/xylan/chitin deacetylase (PgdA/CDA1 family)
VSGTGKGAQSPNFLFDIVSGHTYRVEAWVWVVSGVALVRRNNARINFNITSTTTGQWEKLTTDVVAGSSGIERVRLETSGGGGEYYVDEIKITDLGFSAETIGDFEDITKFTVSGSGATLTEDTTNFKQGTKGMKLSSTNNTSAYATLLKGFELTSVSSFSFWLYIDNVSKMFQNTVSLVSIYTGASDYFIYSIVGSEMRTGWNRIVFSKQDCTVGGGSPSWNLPCYKMLLRALALTGQTVGLTFDDFRITRHERPKVVISFDDANETDYTEAFPYMQTKGLKGTCFIPPVKFGSSGQLTLAQAQEMYAAGWDMGNHSYSHVDLTTLSDAEVKVEIQDCANYLINNNMPRAAWMLAWPFSAFDDTTVESVRSAGIVLARTGNNDINPHEIQEKLKMFRGSVSNTMSISDLTGYIDKLLIRGGVLIYNFHDIKNPASATTDVLPATFQGVIDYLAFKKNQGLLDVVTISEWYNGLDGRRKS